MRIFHHLLFFLMAVILFVAPAFSSLSFTGRYVGGDNGYQGYDGSLLLNGSFPFQKSKILESWFVEPSVDVYRTDDSSGSFKTYSLRLGLIGRFNDFEVAGSISPEINGYKNNSYGAKIGLHIYPEIWNSIAHGRESNMRFGLTGRGEVINHTDKFERLTSFNGPFGKLQFRRAPSDIEITQTNYTYGAEAGVWKVFLSGERTDSSYDKNLDQIPIRFAQILKVAGVNSVVQGFPDHSQYFRCDLDVYSFLKPYASLTMIEFNLDSPDTQIENYGIVVPVKNWIFDFSYEQLKEESASPTQEFFSLEITVPLI